MPTAIADWSTTAALNISINGISIAENCPPANLNDMGRNIMADVKTAFDALPSVTGKLDASAGVFTGTQPVYTGRGAYRHNNDSSLTSGQEYFLPEGSAYPSSPVAGDVVNFY